MRSCGPHSPIQHESINHIQTVNIWNGGYTLLDCVHAGMVETLVRNMHYVAKALAYEIKYFKKKSALEELFTILDLPNKTL